MLTAVDIIHIQRVKSKQGRKVYEQILLRESYREPGAKRSAVKKRTLLNLTKYPPQIVKAFELVIQHQGDLSVLTAPICVFSLIGCLTPKTMPTSRSFCPSTSTATL